MENKDLQDLLKNQFVDDDNKKMIVDEKFHAFIKALPKKHIVKTYPRYRSLLTVFSVLIITFLVSIAIIFNPLDNDDNHHDDDLPIHGTIQGRDLQYVIYLAAKQSLNDKNTGLLNNDADTRYEFSKLSTRLFAHPESLTLPIVDGDSNSGFLASYPFEYIKIENPFRFEINIPQNSNSFVEEKVGFGVIEIIISHVHFITDINSPNEGIEEELILFKGPLGIYICLTNGGSYDPTNQTATLEFSSHKYIDSGSIIKNKDVWVKTLVTLDFLPGDVYGEVIDVKFRNASNEAYSEGNYYPIADSYRRVKCLDLYNLHDLLDIEVIEVTSYISNIDLFENVIEIVLVDGYNLTHVIIDSYTTIIIEDNTEQGIEDLEVGMQILITYPKYYNNYNPISTTIIKLIILN